MDRGSQYRSAIFYHSDEQRRIAEESKANLQKLGVHDKPIVTEIVEATVFYRAEEYHQDYHSKNPLRYSFYRFNSGRDSYLKETWSGRSESVIGKKTKGEYRKLSDEELQTKLTPLQYRVTQKDGTEPPFDNLYWDNKREGIYVDIVSGEPLFSSTDKYKSGTGWPSFTQPIDENTIRFIEDSTLGMQRIEVRSRAGNSHLGHVFYDDPSSPNGTRFCINSAALRFIPVDEMNEEGYAYLVDFVE